jgi:uncharacterized protein (DUF2249 family)
VRVQLRTFLLERLAMTSTLAYAVGDVLDLRAIAPRERHSMIFSRFDALQPGQSLQLLNDHDPQPLRSQFDDRSRGQFEWAALEAGPAVWRVQITRVGNKADKAAAPARDSCCSGGACCG